MALTTTTLAGAITQGQTLVTLTAYTSPAAGPLSKVIVVIDGEAMLVTDATLTPTLQVVRGYNNPCPGQATIPASSHNILAPVVYGQTSDFTQTIGNPGGAAVYSYGASGAVTVPVVDATIYLDKATAAAMTLADPAKDQRNTVRFISRTDAAHTITYTNGFYGNTTTSDVATFPATLGAVFTIVAQNGQWCAVATADDGVTIG